jgi:hypothetical protein
MEIDNKVNKYFIRIESMYTQGVGDFYMISSNKTSIEMLRMELLKNIKYIEYTCVVDGDLCGWVFYEDIYKIISVKPLDDKYNEYTLYLIHSHEYEPSKCKVKNIKKINWNKTINKKYVVTRENEIMKEDFVYNTISNEYDIINIHNFNILGDIKIQKNMN